MAIKSPFYYADKLHIALMKLCHGIYLSTAHFVGKINMQGKE